MKGLNVERKRVRKRERVMGNNMDIFINIGEDTSKVPISQLQVDWDTSNTSLIT